MALRIIGYREIAENIAKGNGLLFEGEAENNLVQSYLELKKFEQAAIQGGICNLTIEGNLDYDDAEICSPRLGCSDFRHLVVHQHLNLSYSRFELGLSIKECVIKQSLLLYRMTCLGDLFLGQLEIGEDLDFRELSMDIGKLRFDRGIKVGGFILVGDNRELYWKCRSELPHCAVKADPAIYRELAQLTMSHQLQSA